MNCKNNQKTISTFASIITLSINGLNTSMKRHRVGTSLVVQWLTIHLPMQGTWVRSLVWEDPTCCGATKPMCHNYWAWALEPASHNYWACMPQLLKPTRLEPVLRKKRSHCDEKPTHNNEDPTQLKIKKTTQSGWMDKIQNAYICCLQESHLWMDKDVYMCVCVCVCVCTHIIEYYSAIKPKAILPFATTGMYLKGIMLSEMSERERQILYTISFICEI